MAHRYLLADVFTDTVFAGNQLAVFFDADKIADGQLQRIAREMNLSETVFVYPERDHDVPIRIFTTVTELPFAGHPILGTAAIVAHQRGGVVTVTLGTGRGPISVEITVKGERHYLCWMTQPTPSVRPFEHAEAALRALGVGRSQLPVELYDNGVPHVYVALDSVDAVLAATPNVAALAAIPGLERLNFFAGVGADYTTRMFSPHDMVPEDPATGSAAGPLALHLTRHGRIALGEQITISQGEVVGRPSRLFASVTPDGGGVRIRVGGEVRIVGRGELWA